MKPSKQAALHPNARCYLQNRSWDHDTDFFSEHYPIQSYLSIMCLQIKFLRTHSMEVIRFDSDMYSGVLCPISDIEIDFQDDNITDYISDTFVLGVFLSIQPEECAIGGELNDLWMQFYAENSVAMDLEEIITSFPGPYKAIKVNSYGMACGPMRDTAYYAVPKDSTIEFILRTEESE